jgi:hypothetical protein
LAAKQKVLPEDVDVQTIRRKLREHGAILSLEDVYERQKAQSAR